MLDPNTSLAGTCGFLGCSDLAVRSVSRCGTWMGAMALAAVFLATSTSWADRLEGFDVSHWQGEITPSEWTQAYNAGYVFCFTKATQGNYFTDGEFVDNMIEGSAAGILMGCYHFADPEYVTATAEANYFVSVAGPYVTDGYLRPVLDLEWGSSLGATALSNWVNTWMDTVEAQTGVEPMIYCNTYYATSCLNSTVANRTLWIAQWPGYKPGDSAQPSIGVFNSWSFWQWTDSCPIPGLGSVDGDLFNGSTMTELQAYVIGGGSQPPTITQHPSNQSVAEGDTAQFSVQAAGTAPLSYRWQKNSVDLNNGGHYSGVTTTTLTVSNADSSDEANYRCRVTNDYGNATSNAATLTIVELGDGCVRNAGFEDGFTSGVGNYWTKFNVSGNPDFSSSTNSHSGTYCQQVYCGNSEVGGVYQQYNAQPGSAFSVSAYLRCDSDQVDMEARLGVDPYGGTDPSSGDIIWKQKPWITWEQCVVSGTVQGTSGRITVFLKATQTRDWDTGYCWFDDVSPDCDALPDPPTITQHPSNQSVAEGGTAQFTVAATGEGTLTYRWQKNGLNLSDGGHYSGVTTTTLIISDADSSDAASYRCVVSNAGGDTTSNSATLTVTPTEQPGDFDDDQDVDLDDFAVFQRCLSGSGNPQNDPACAGAKLEGGDDDVDDGDLAKFLGCISGSDIPGDVNCLND